MCGKGIFAKIGQKQCKTAKKATAIAKTRKATMIATTRMATTTAKTKKATNVVRCNQKETLIRNEVTVAGTESRLNNVRRH